MPKNKKLALNSGIQTYQILTSDNRACITSLSSILLAVMASSMARWSCLFRIFGGGPEASVSSVRDAFSYPLCLSLFVQLVSEAEYLHFWSLIS